jgi:hypothetical protein
MVFELLGYIGKPEMHSVLRIDVRSDLILICVFFTFFFVFYFNFLKVDLELVIIIVFKIK